MGEPQSRPMNSALGDFREIVILVAIQKTGTVLVLRCVKHPASFTADSAL